MDFDCIKYINLQTTMILRWNAKEMKNLIFILIVWYGFEKLEIIDNEEKSGLFKSLNYMYKTMLSYCLKCRKKRESKNPRIIHTLLWKCALCNNKNLLKNKKQVLSILGLETHLSKILLIGDILF